MRLHHLREHVTWDNSGHKKTPPTLIDLQESVEGQEQLKGRYTFIDWNKAVTCFTGFDDTAISLIAAS
jgi:hypothetical protein